MAINVRCECGFRVVVGDAQAGKTVSCRECDADVVIPLPEGHDDPIPEHITCETCGEQVKYAARKCRYCGERLKGYNKRAARAGVKRECDYCGEEFERSSKKCPHCGERVGGRRGGKMKTIALARAYDLGKQSLIWALVSILICPFPLAQIGLYLGIQSRKAANEAGEPWPMTGILGTVFGGLVTMALLAMVLLIALA